MKQTQTKLFDFSDVGLDFCSGSKTLFPDRFKRMLALGYNSQAVVSVSVVGNQVTFNYGVSHGYVADRVLKVSSGPLAAINNGEFVIDRVAATSITMTIDAAPISIAGGFTTIVAPLGWELVYEQANIQIYKFKHIDDSDMFIRLCYNNLTSASKNFIMPSIGHSFDPLTGVIDDVNAYKVNTSANDWVAGHKWLFESGPSVVHNNSSYSQGYSTFGKGMVIGSEYNFLIMCSIAASAYARAFYGVVPTVTLDYDQLDYPFMLAPYFASGVGSSSSLDIGVYTASGQGVLGNYSCVFERGTGAPAAPTASSSILPTELDTFNTTTATPIYLYEQSTRQNLGLISDGLYLCQFGTSGAPSTSHTTTPSLHADVDTVDQIYIHPVFNAQNLAVFLATAIAEIKIGEY